MRPDPSVGIHAHPCDQVVTLEEELLPFRFAGTLGTGKPWQAEVFLPHPYTFLLMKLFAFRDRINGPQKDLGRHHALDLYSVVALTNETEWQECREFSYRLQNGRVIIETGQLWPSISVAFSSSACCDCANTHISVLNSNSLNSYRD